MGEAEGGSEIPGKPPQLNQITFPEWVLGDLGFASSQNGDLVIKLISVG
jgi:hypothetical protein